MDMMYQVFQEDMIKTWQDTREVVDHELSKWRIHGLGRVWEIWPQIL